MRNEKQTKGVHVMDEYRLSILVQHSLIPIDSEL